MPSPPHRPLAPLPSAAPCRGVAGERSWRARPSASRGDLEARLHQSEFGLDAVVPEGDLLAHPLLRRGDEVAGQQLDELVPHEWIYCVRGQGFSI